MIKHKHHCCLVISILVQCPPYSPTFCRRCRRCSLLHSSSSHRSSLPSANSSSCPAGRPGIGTIAGLFSLLGGPYACCSSKSPVCTFHDINIITDRHFRSLALLHISWFNDTTGRRRNRSRRIRISRHSLTTSQSYSHFCRI